MISRQLRNYWLLPIAFALIFVGYLSVWLPNDAVGLAIIGLELGEWVKFLPETRAGNVALSRVWFYAPPLTLATLVALFVAPQPRSWQNWLARLIACAVATLALPSVPDILDGGTSDLLRVGYVGLVCLICLVVRWSNRWLMIALAIIGGVMPFVGYIIFRPIIAQYLTYTPAIGIGVWLNLAGHLLVVLTRFGKS